MSMDIDVYCLHGPFVDLRIGLVIESYDWWGCKCKTFNLARNQPWITEQDESGEDCRTSPQGVSRHQNLEVCMCFKLFHNLRFGQVGDIPRSPGIQQI